MALMCKGWQICPPAIRWIVFLVLSLCMFSYMYTYDTPVALQEQLQDDPYNLSNVEYNLLFSAYAWPNVIFPIIFGVLTDVVGVNKMLMLLYIGMIIGNGIFIYGIHLQNFIVMLVGRCFYGISAESFAMAETPLLYEYFFGKELSFALGFNLSFSRLGSAANDVLTYNFYTNQENKENPNIDGVVFSMLMGGVVLMPFCLLLLSSIISYRVCIESKKKAEDKIPYKQVSEGSEIGMTTKLMGNGYNHNGYDSTQDQDREMSNGNGYGGYEQDMSARYDASMPSLAQQWTMGTTVKHEDDEFDDDDDEHSEIDNDMEEEETNDEDENRFRFSDFKKFDTRYWLLVVNCCFQYGCVVPWMKIGGSYMYNKFEYSHHKANEYLMIPYIVAAIVTPLIGFWVDYCGRRCQLLLVATVMLTGSHYVLGWVSPQDIGIDPEDKDTLPLAGLIGLGLGYSVFCAVIWPAFAIVIPPKLVGTGYGIPTSAYNLVLGLFFLLVGVLTKDNDSFDQVPDDKYTDVEWFLLSTCICSIVTVFMLWHADRNMGNMLGLPTSQHVQPRKKNTMMSIGARDY